MLRRFSHFEIGLLYFVLMILVEMVLPVWVGDENGIIENLQLLWLLGGFVYCYKNRKAKFRNWGGDSVSLWNAGMIYFFLLFMREISWGRVLFTNPDGSSVQYSQMGLYGKLVHPLVGVLLVVLLVLLYKARVWRMLCSIQFPAKSFVVLLLFIFAAWLAEKGKYAGFHGQVAEELAEFGAYMMMYFLLRDAGEQLQAD